MSQVQVRKAGKLVLCSPVAAEQAESGCVVRLEGVGAARVTIGQLATIGQYTVTIVDGEATLPDTDAEIVGDLRMSVTQASSDAPPRRWTRHSRPWKATKSSGPSGAVAWVRSGGRSS